MITKLTNKLGSLLALPESGESVGGSTTITALQVSDKNILVLWDLSKIDHKIEESEQINAKCLTMITKLNYSWILWVP